MTHQELRKLPSVDRLLQDSTVAAARASYGPELTLQAARGALDAARQAILEAGQPCPEISELAQAVLTRLETATRPTLQPVVNATGVLIHTNLGRAPLSAATQAAMETAASGYSNLEYDLAAGQRGSRYVHAVDALCRLTGAEDALVVNNNAAAIMLCLMALARDREVIISRGQLVEIGGGFRIPEVLKTSGATLVEVGTTNRTHCDDYERAITPATAALLRVHTSNFRQIGFTAEVSLAELVTLGRKNALPVVDDLGSGTLLDTTAFGLACEPRSQDSVQAGATLVTFSGDKLLGGPQAGLIVGQRAAIAKLRTHPLTRALRVDKTTLAGLAATLGHYLRGEATTAIPIWRMIAASQDQLAERATRWADQLHAHGVMTQVISGHSTVGGGSLPGETLPTRLLAFPTLSADAIAARLRRGRPAIVARIVDDTLCFDPRTVLPGEDDTLVAGILAAVMSPQ
jgi:L-seryl-tRNA(Ser) seleniumtransferase